MFNQEQLKQSEVCAMQAALDSQLGTAVHWVAGWTDFFADADQFAAMVNPDLSQDLAEYHDQRRQPRPSKEVVAARIAALNRAGQLVGALLAAAAKDVGKDIAAQIREEFPGAIGPWVATMLETADPDAYWVR